MWTSNLSTGARLPRSDDSTMPARHSSGAEASSPGQAVPHRTRGRRVQAEELPAIAAVCLRRALRIDPSRLIRQRIPRYDLFPRRQSPTRALKYWNRAGKPFIESVQARSCVANACPLCSIAHWLFLPASVLHLADYQTSRARLAGLGVFPSPRIQLIARPEGKFDAISICRSAMAVATNLAALDLDIQRHRLPDDISRVLQLGGSAMNVTSLLRWDAQKRRLTAALSGPLHRNPRWRYRLGFDLRNENWDIRESFTGRVVHWAQ